MFIVIFLALWKDRLNNDESGVKTPEIKLKKNQNHICKKKDVEQDLVLHVNFN
jgi:hypothetical protein